MSNQGIKGIDVRQTISALIFRSFLLDETGAKVTSGTTNLYLYELQDDGTLKSYDFNDNTFKTGALTTEVNTMTHRQGNNSTTNTGIWTKALSTLTGFTIGGVYLAVVTNDNAQPSWQAREFQFGSLEGDDGAFVPFTVGASSSTTVVKTDRAEADNFWNGSVIAFISGAYRGLARKVTSYANTNGAFTVATLPGSPSSGDRGIIIGRIE